MRRIILILLMMTAAAGAFSQTYYVYTSKQNGNWNDMNTWSSAPRTDGVPRTKVILSAAYTVSVDNNVNNFPLGDAEIYILGSLQMTNNTILRLSQTSRVEIQNVGRIIGTNSTQQVLIGGVLKYDGSKDHTKTGASFASQATGISPNGFTSNLVLPVKLLSFTAFKTSNDVQLKWVTASEVSNDYFAVERSYDGTTFTTIATINGSATTNVQTSYSYSDNSALGTIAYYRLKQVDTKGTSSYSEVRSLIVGKEQPAQVYVTDNLIKVKLAQDVSSKTNITVLTANGQVITRKVINEGKTASLSIGTTVPGVLFVNITDNKQMNQTVRLMF
ncbi:MAG: hypothetical protein ABW174_09175 [Flavitalea sp.]